MNEQKVYIVLCDTVVDSVFYSKEKAFSRIPQKDEFTEVTQSIRTWDGVESIVPTEDNFYLDVPIYVHVIGHTENLAGIPIECKEETFVYEIQEFKVK